MIVWAKVGGILAAIALVFGAGWQVRAWRDTAKTETVAAQTESHEIQQARSDAANISQESKTYEQVLDTAPISPPDVRVCYYRTHPATVPSPAGTGSGAPLSAQIPGAAQPAPGPDIGPSLEQLARQADAQVAGLQSYIAKVCRAGT